MNIPSRRKLGAIALILAGIAAVGVPLYVWHGATPQSTSPSPTTTSGNNNNGNGNTAGTNPNTNNHGQNTNTGDNDDGSGGSGSNSCSEHKSHDSESNAHTTHTRANGRDNDQHNGNAFGQLAKQMDKTVALVKSMGSHNSAFHLHHDTNTDNDTVHDPQGAGHDSSDHDSSCASAEESNEQD